MTSTWKRTSHGHAPRCRQAPTWGLVLVVMVVTSTLAACATDGATSTGSTDESLSTSTTFPDDTGPICGRVLEPLSDIAVSSSVELDDDTGSIFVTVTNNGDSAVRLFDSKAVVPLDGDGRVIGQATVPFANIAIMLEPQASHHLRASGTPPAAVKPCASSSSGNGSLIEPGKYDFVYPLSDGKSLLASEPVALEVHPDGSVSSG